MYKKSGGLKHFDFFIGDIIFLMLGYFLAWVIRFKGDFHSTELKMFFTTSVVLLAVYLVVVLASKTYKDIINRLYGTEILNVLLRVAISYVLLVLYFYVIKSPITLSRLIFAYAAGFSFILILAFRFVWKKIIRTYLLKKSSRPKMLLIVDKGNAQACVNAINGHNYNAFEVIGLAICDADRVGETIGNFPVLANEDTLKSFVLTEVVDEVILSLNDKGMEEDLTDYLLTAGITVHISLMENMKKYSHAVVEEMGDSKVITISNNMASGIQLILKRAFDILAGLVGTIFTGILYLILAPQIKKADPGPALFRQVRIGKNGRQFQIYKFRSMYMDAEARKAELMAQNEMSGFMFKMENDPRILPGIGQKIRDLSLDEFPQFINVLKGEMSLVGTRPPTLGEFQQYEAHHKARLSFKPGLTGMWQVSGRSNITDFEEIVALDNKYINNWSVWLDLKIILKTVKVVLTKEGSK